MNFYIINLFVRAVFASFIRKVKEFRVITGNTLNSRKVFSLKRTLTLLGFTIINLFIKTLRAILNGNVKISVISWAGSTSFLHKDWSVFRASETLVKINMIYMIRWALLALFCCIVKVMRKIASDAGLCCLKRQRFWALTFVFLRVKLLVKRTFVTCFILVVEEKRNWTLNTFAVCFERCIGVAWTLLACYVVS